MNDVQSMRGKTCIVTGANSGIGLEIALELARNGASLIILDRDEALHAVQAIQEVAPEAQVDCVVVDLSDHNAVREVATDIASHYEKLDVLINNAGRHLVRRETSVDGLEMNLALNCLAPFMLTHLLLDKLIDSSTGGSPARIINIASEAHRVPGRFNFEDINTEQESMNYAYGKSKIANILWVKALARRLSGTGVTINAVCPGLVATNIFDNYLPAWVSRVAPVIAQTGLMATSKGGAQIPIHLACNQEFNDVSGEYFSSHAIMKRLPQISALADQDLQERIYSFAEQMTGLSFSALSPAQTLSKQNQ